jgi:hypothetical protein
MSDLKGNNELKNKTVVMAVGDHNSWMLAARNSEVMSFAKTLSVPFYFYIPDYLKKNIYYDPKRAISHKDIISTLVPLTLSEAKYFNLGANIFDKNKSPNQFYALNSDSSPYKLLHTEGDDVHLMNQKAQAYLMINHIYFQREFCKMKASWYK